MYCYIANLKPNDELRQGMHEKLLFTTVSAGSRHFCRHTYRAKD